MVSPRSAPPPLPVPLRAAGLTGQGLGTALSAACKDEKVALAVAPVSWMNQSTIRATNVSMIAGVQVY